MLSRSSTREPLASSLSPSSSDDKCNTHLRPLPFPVMSRTSTRASSASYSSTMPLTPEHEPSKARRSVAQKLFSGWKRSTEKDSDSEAQHPTGQSPYDKGGGGTGAGPPSLRWWQGWRVILFDSWLNIMILLIPVAGILKVAMEESEQLIFAACLLAMIPLVKLHDLATGVLSRRIGGTKAGLLNSSLSNIVELVVAIIALRKCELRVVQSSLIGAMLSKLLLILGMCFFAGGTRFSEQGFDSTATQIHSSLLSISVGAVLLPAAFHFALTYSKDDDADDMGTTLQEQKQDILRMSHGVAVVLLFIYGSYLVFQLWSHTHLYEDSTEPSKQLPVAESVRFATARMRQKSNNIVGRLTPAPSLERLRTRSLTNLRTFGHKASGSRPVTPAGEKVVSPVEEEPETTLSLDETPRTRVGTGPYLHMHPGRSTSTNSAGVNSKTALLMSPFGTTSQVTLANPIAQPADSTVRLVSDRERFVVRRVGSGSESDSNSPGSPTSGSGDDSFESESGDEKSRRSQAHSAHLRGRARTPISDVLSAYYQESLHDGGARRSVASTPDSEWRTRNSPSPSQYSVQSGRTRVKPLPDMSWTLTLLLLSSVTVLVAIDAEWMVDTMDHLSPSISKEWIGLILLPAVSAIAECIVAVNVSVKDQLAFSISVAVGSTIQTALFVIPTMVILGWILDKPLALLFDPFESVVLYISVHTMGYVVADGKSNWLEGVILICLYIVIAVTFWFYPGSNFSTNLAICTESPPIAI
ncbi:Sodium/calcium exchanger protein-domain-containing protein [Cerioporus squamosus]|nr:Sodium/calcium exchanger protein-domain-containing protein [Cerioporus squamosus]